MDNQNRKKIWEYLCAYFWCSARKIGTCIHNFHSDGGPLQLEVSFKTKGNFNLVGKLRKEVNENCLQWYFEVNETFFEGKAQIRQEITIINTNLNTVEAVNYQVCKEVCINQERKIHFYYPALPRLLFLQQLKLLSQVQWWLLIDSCRLFG
jgi:hypothetical protein